MVIITEIVIPFTGNHGTPSLMMYLIVYKMSHYLYMFIYMYINILYILQVTYTFWFNRLLISTPGTRLHQGNLYIYIIIVCCIYLVLES